MYVCFINAAAGPIEAVLGFGDTASFGATRYIRQWQGLDVPGIECSGAYQAGEWVAFAVELASGVGGVTKVGGKYALKKALKEGGESFGDDAARLTKPCILCFEAGTPVETVDGQKPIEEIKEGDQVLSYDEQAGALEYQTVTQTFSRLADDVWELKVEGEAKPIGVTSEHPFFFRVHGARSDASRKDDGEWFETWQIRAGDEIRLASGRWAKVVSNLPMGEARVYNFTVDKNHNYFVGSLMLLTHNTCPKFTPDQDALIQLAKDAKNRGSVTEDQAKTLKKWADEYQVPFRGPEAHPGRKFGSNPHIHVGPVNYLPVK